MGHPRIFLEEAMSDSPIAALIMKLGKKSEEDYSVDDEAVMNQARDLIKGVNNNDPGAVAKSMREMIRLCEGGEGPAEAEVD
jgi:hypothetical protein